jgi:hypothetical protein
MPTDAVAENPQKYLIAKKYMYDYPNRLGWRQNVLKALITFMLWCLLQHGKGHLPARQFIKMNRLIPVPTHLCFH